MIQNFFSLKDIKYIKGKFAKFSFLVHVQTHRLHLCAASASAQKVQLCLTQQPGLVTGPEAPRSALLAVSHKYHVQSLTQWCIEKKSFSYKQSPAFLLWYIFMCYCSFSYKICSLFLMVFNWFWNWKSLVWASYSWENKHITKESS